jgi:DnaJ-class molecular chaperone
MTKTSRHISTTSTTRTRVNKNGNSNKAGYKQCNMCHGSGVVRKGK